jgi:hypothetical protein
MFTTTIECGRLGPPSDWAHENEELLDASQT